MYSTGSLNQIPASVNSTGYSIRSSTSSPLPMSIETPNSLGNQSMINTPSQSTINTPPQSMINTPSQSIPIDTPTQTGILVQPSNQPNRLIRTPPDRSGVYLWLILFIVVIVGISIFLFLRPPSSVVPPAQPQVPCTGNLSNVASVTDTQQFEPCCNLSGNPINRYYDKINNWTVINLSSEDSPSSTQVCLEFCDQVQLPTDCTSQGKEYNNCISALKPQGCTDPAEPIAREGNTPFYAVGKGRVSCYTCPS